MREETSMANAKPLHDAMDEISDTVGEQAFRKIRGDIV